MALLNLMGPHLKPVKVLMVGISSFQCVNCTPFCTSVAKLQLPVFPLEESVHCGPSVITSGRERLKPESLVHHVSDLYVSSMPIYCGTCHRHWELTLLFASLLAYLFGDMCLINYELFHMLIQ